MSSEIALTVRGLSKVYRLTQQRERPDTLVQAVFGRLRGLGRQGEHEQFFALRDIDIEVARGSIVGIIGHNGAGKSTFLKVLSRITFPTSGRVDVYGRVGSLLEVGTGFHPELTGRENIFLNGTILGMRHREIGRRFDEIVEFAGVERFLDTPVKRYSSGMYVRLAFAVAAHLDTDILLVDEVLAVGDADFQKRSLGKMNEVTRGGRTVIVVSHQTDTVKALCDRVIMMERGAVFADGPAAEVVSTYRGRLVGSADAASGARAPVGRGGYLITSLTVPELVDSGAAITASYEVVRQREGAGRFFVSMSIFDSADLLIAHCDSRVFESMFPERPSSHGQIRVYDLLLRPGEYKVDFYVGSPDVDDHWVNAARFTVTGMPFQGQVFDHRHLDKGVVLTRFEVKLGE